MSIIEFWIISAIYSQKQIKEADEIFSCIVVEFIDGPVFFLVAPIDHATTLPSGLFLSF
ncbi:MAG: hypothetical protein ABIP54_05090 [Candidatus Andersenbacteria bacterium]